MGNCASSSDDHGATARSAAIDRQIEEDSKIFRKECKILLLGRSLSFKPPYLRPEYGFGSPANPLAQNPTHCSLPFLASSSPGNGTNAGQR